MAAMLRGASSLVSRQCATRVAFRPAMAPVRAPVSQRGALQVVAAEGDKPKVQKKMDSAVKRAMIAEERRMTNKARKSACATRIKKVIKMADQLVASAAKDGAETEVKGLEKLISEAFTEIDKAVVKGILHKNNGARKKARCSRYKKKVLITAGLWAPPADHPDYPKWARIHAKAAAPATATA